MGYILHTAVPLRLPLRNCVNIPLFPTYHTRIAINNAIKHNKMISIPKYQLSLKNTKFTKVQKVLKEPISYCKHSIFLKEFIR